MTNLAFNNPPVVRTAPPTNVPPILLHSSWIEGPPFFLIAPATPLPKMSSVLAALTITSVSNSVISP